MPDLPHTQIDHVPSKGSSDYPALTAITTSNLVGPGAANRQPNELDTRFDTIAAILDKLIENLNALTGKDKDGANVTPDGEPQYLDREGPDDMLGNLKMGSNKVTGLADGADPTDAVAIQQLDDYLKLDGSSVMAGVLDHGGYRAANAADASNDSDLVPLSQVQSLIEAAKPHIPEVVSFQSPGNFTWTIPSWARACKVIVTGGGAEGATSPGSAGGTAISMVDLKSLLDAGATEISLVVGDKVVLGDTPAVGTSSFGTYASASGATPPTITTDGVTFTGAPGTGTSGDVLIEGGSGVNDTNDDDGKEEANGGSSYWGNGPAPGGGQNSHREIGVPATSPGAGIVYIEIYG